MNSSSAWTSSAGGGERSRFVSPQLGLYHTLYYCRCSVSSQNEIDRDEAEKQKLEAEVAAARERLEVVENRLSLKTARMENYDKAIAKSEAAYLQILESSQVIKIGPI